MPYIEFHLGEIADLAHQYGTPLVLYSEKILLEDTARLKSALPEVSSLAYSIKANPNPAFLRLLSGSGLMMEAASAAELSLALRTGVPPESIFLGGPFKGREAIEIAVDACIPAILVESATDLGRVKKIAKGAHTTVDVLLRVNPVGITSSAVLKMGGVASQFGIDEEQLPDIIRECDGKNVRYAGLFLYTGSQHFLAQEIVENTRYLCRLSNHLYSKGLPLSRMLDFGGGFGVPEDESQPELNLTELKEGLESVFREEIEELTCRGLQRTVFESGRYLISRAGVYVARIVDIKRSKGKQYVVIDGGINNLGIRQLMYRSFEPQLEVYGREIDQLGDLMTITGPTCTPIDIVHKGIRLSGLKLGDLILIHNFGAYSISYSPIHFCGHPWPAEVLIRTDGSHLLVRRRGRLEEACGIGYSDPKEIKSICDK